MAQQAKRRRRETLLPADRERQLLDVARQLLLDNESGAFSVEMVTEASGVAKGTFYLYFNSKDHLLARVWADYLDTFIATMQSLLVDGNFPDWSTMADALIEQMVRYDIANAPLHRAVLFRASGDALRLLHQADVKVVDMLADAISAAVAAGAAASSHPRTSAALLYHAVDGLLNSAYLSNEKPDVDEIIAAAQELTHRALRLGQAEQ